MSTCPHCAASVQPEARFCASCGEALERRCGACSTVLPDRARFCPACGMPTDTEPTAELRDTTEERKVVSVIFADLVGFTAASDGADPEDMRRRLAPYHEGIREEVERYGGRIEKLMGDGVLAVFGAPTAHEDDAERAVRAGLRIQERIADMAGESRLTARVAVGTGEAVVALEGTTMDREGLVGDVVNTTSRLQHEAPPGSVLVDAATHRLTRRVFQHEERPPVAVRGKAEPLSVWLAVAPTARLGADLEDDGVELVGRRSELRLLTDAFDRTIDDTTSQLVTVVGEPGVGKSRMVRELRRHIDELPELIRWRQGRCLPYGEGITYWAMGEIVKAEAGILETDTPGTALGKLSAALEPLIGDSEERSWVAGRLAPLVSSAEDAGPAGREERLAAWNRFLSALGEQRPTVVVIEDLHWADASLVDFLAAVPDATRGIPLLLVCTVRPDFFEEHPTWGAGQRNAMTVGLDPLEGEETARLLDSLLGGEELDDESRRVVIERSGGNPLWTQEFVRMVQDRGGGGGEQTVPQTVQAVVAARLDLLDPGAKTVVQAAATLGKSFWAGAVATLVDENSIVEPALAEMVRRDLVRRERVSTVAGEAEYSFAHAVVQEVAYTQTPRRVRWQRHHAVARWLEQMAGERVADRAEVIAHHDAEALRLAVEAEIEDVTRLIDGAVVSHRRAADQIMSLDTTSARAHLERALELLPPGDHRRGLVLARLGDVLSIAGSADASIKVLQEAADELEQVGDIEAWGAVMSRLAQALWIQGDMEADDEVVKRGIGVLEQHPPGPALAALYSNAAGRLWLRGDSIEAALDYIATVRPVVEVHGDLEARRRVLSAEGGARFDAGDVSALDSFRVALDMAMEADDSAGIGSSHLNLGEQLRTSMGLAEALEVHRRGLHMAVQRHQGGIEQFIRASLAVDLFLVGDWDGALEQVDAGLNMPERLVYMEWAFLGPQLVIAAGRQEPDENALAEANRSIEVAEALQDLQAIIPSMDGAAFVHLMAGDTATAADLARRIVDRAGGTRFLVDAWATTVWALSLVDELGRLESVLPALRTFEMPRPQAQLAVIDALLRAERDPREAIVSIVDAAEQLALMQLNFEAVIALAHAVGIARTQDDVERVDRLRARARALFFEARADVMMERLGL